MPSLLNRPKFPSFPESKFHFNPLDNTSIIRGIRKFVLTAKKREKEERLVIFSLGKFKQLICIDYTAAESAER